MIPAKVESVLFLTYTGFKEMAEILSSQMVPKDLAVGFWKY